MAARTIYLIRHGQYNPENQKDRLGNGLTATGIAQAQYSAERMADVPLSAIHTSSLLRAAQTARFIAENTPFTRDRKRTTLGNYTTAALPGDEVH